MSEFTRIFDDPGLRLNRRHFFSRTSLGLGGAALASLLSGSAAAGTGRDPNADPMAIDPAGGGILRAYHVPPKAKRVIYLFMSGGPSQLDLFDYKPLLEPDERQGPARVGPDGPAADGDVGQPGDACRWPARIFKFARHGQSGAWVSELLPHTARVADELCIINSLYTEAINHDPAITFFQTGSTIAGRPSMGAWLSYGLGSANREPADVLRADQPEAARPAAVLAALGQRVSCRRSIRGSSSARGPTRCSISTTRPGSRRRAAARCSTGSASCTRSNTTRRSTRRSRPGSPSTRWPTGCRPRCPR